MPVKTRSVGQLAILGSGSSRTSTFREFAPYYLNPERDSYETIITLNHARNKDGVWRVGGPMTLTRDWTTYQLGTANTTLVNGPVRIASPKVSLPALSPYPARSDLELFAMGGTAISRTEPTNPAFDLSQALGELKADGLPKAPTLRHKDYVDLARNSGDNYLNAAFGWAPFVSDLRSFATAVRDSDDILQKYHKESSQGLHRRYTFPEEHDERIDLNLDFSFVPPITQLGPVSGYQKQAITRRTWFSGRYIYHIPADSAQYSKIAQFGSDARKLLGVELTPETVYNLTPWTWALDYFGTTGDMIHNISALGRDGLVMQYGFIMSHTVKETFRYGFSVRTGPMTSYRVEETKVRRMASPYGFGVNPDGLSSKQVAVLAALGLSRV